MTKVIYYTADADSTGIQSGEAILHNEALC